MSRLHACDDAGLGKPRNILRMDDLHMLDAVTTGVEVTFDEPGDYRLAVGNTTAGTLAVSADWTEGDDHDGSAGGDVTDAESADGPDDESAASDPADDGSTPSQDATDSSDESVPGFGLPATVAAVLAAAALARRRSP